MPQINKGDTFANGEQVTGARLNQLIDSATILPAIITDQTNIATNTVAVNDSILIYDLSATALREATPSDLLNSNIAVTTSSVTAGANADIVITPNDAVVVTGATYTSANGLTVVVTTPSAHGLIAGQVVLISGAGAGYNGTFRITAVTTTPTNTFTYVQGVAATPATNVGCSYTKKGTVKNVANKAITGNLYVDGDAIITGTTVQTGAVTQSGAVTQNGAVTQTGAVSSSNLTATLTTASTAITQTSTDSSTKIATTAFVKSNPATCKAWVKFDGAGNMLNSYNIASVVRTSIGSFTITFSTPQPNANYIVSGSVPLASNNDGNTGGNFNIINTPTTSSFSIFTYYTVTYGGGHVGIDFPFVTLMIFGN
jgi:hypothetical protein